MNQRSEPLLFFLKLPDPRKLCCTTMSLQMPPSHGDMRNLQLKTCREILFQYPDVIASPVMESFDIIIIMAIEFFKTGVIQAYAQGYSMQEKIFFAPLASLKPLLEEFDIAPNVLRSFNGCRSAVIQTFSIANNWCYILPSMKKGQIISISHQMAPECPFQTYSDIQKHWSSLYGYELPQEEEEGLVYCSVYFKMVGEKLFTYPLSCIRTQPVQVLPRVDLQEALNFFLPDLRRKLQSVCGFPVQMTTKPLCSTISLISPGSQNFYIRPLNLTTKTISQPIPSHPHGSGPPEVSSDGGPFKPSPEAPIVLMGKRCLSCREEKVVQGNRYSVGAANLNATENCRAFSCSSAVIPMTSLPSQNLQTLQKRARIVPVFRSRGPARSRAGNEERWRGQTYKSPGNLIAAGASLLSSQGHTGVRAGSACEEPPGDWFEFKPKKPKSGVQDVDVENYARNNQLSKVSATTLQAWLKSRGIRVRSKEKKEVLIAKVSCCLSES